MKTKSKQKSKKVSFGKRSFSPRLFIFLMLFAGLGAFLLIKSFAATDSLLLAKHLVTGSSVNSSVIKDDTGSGKKDTDVVQIANPAGTTNGKAVLRDPSILLDSGQYRACLSMLAVTGTINVTLDITDATAGAPGTTVGTVSGTIPKGTSYTSNLCVNFTYATGSRISGAIVSNKTDGGTMRVGAVVINRTGGGGSCVTNAGTNRFAVNTANGFEDLPADKIIYEDTAVPNNRVYDAGSSVWRYDQLNADGNGSQLYAIKLWKGSDVCWSGGRVRSITADTANSDWQAWHDLNGFRIGGMKNFKFEGVYVRNFGDLINVSDNNGTLSDNVSVNGSILRHSHDDCIQNDKFAGMLVKDSLLDGCYSGLSARMSDADVKAGTINGSGKTFKVQDSLIWLQPMSPVFKGTNPGNGAWFKWENVAVSRGMKLSLSNVTLMARQDANHQSLGNEAGSLLSSCDRLTILWTGSGTFPGKSSWLSSGCTNLTILEGQAAKDEWIRRVDAWYNAHTQFNDLKQANSVYF